MPTRSRSRSGYRSAAACNAVTWSSSAGSAFRKWISRSHAGPRPGVPRPSATTTANPRSANHCDTRNPLRVASTRCIAGPPYGSSNTGNVPEPGSWPVGNSTAVRSSVSPARIHSTLGVTTGSSTSERIGLPPTEIDVPLIVAPSTSNVPPDNDPVYTPGSVVICRTPSASDQVYRWISVGSVDALNNTVPPSVPSPSRNCSPAGVTSLPSTTKWRVSVVSTAQTSQPSSSRSGTPCTTGTQSASSSVRTTSVAPVIGSTDSTVILVCARFCTTTSRPCRSQCTETTYSYPPCRQSTSTREPSSPSSHSVTSAFAVPATGYGIATGREAGSVGSETYQVRRPLSSARSTSSRSPSGDHHAPWWRPSSSPATYSARP